ncbi:MAG: hypothetical protein GEV13_21775 [Rhodospirillales bacterium]|nr:hypothetical protein [Rhodospirillales bacterium]
MARVALPNSTYLDLTSYHTTTATTVAEAYQIQGPPVPSNTTLNVALILPRANDPTALLQSNWATRQATLQQLEDNGTLWSTYGADPAAYAAARAELTALGIPLLGDAAGSDGYISSAESRTIWVQLTPHHFADLFGTTLYGDGPFLQYWHGELSLPDTIGATGIWFDSQPLWGTYPATSDLSDGAVVHPPEGPLSIGNALLAAGNESSAFAGDMARWFYNFPLTGLDVPTATVGIVESGTGDVMEHGVTRTFQEALNHFRERAGISTPGDYYVVANNGQSYTQGNPGERTLDVAVVTSANPNSTMGLYAGSGFGNHATSNNVTAYQAAFWDLVNNPGVVSSSFGIFQQASPGSPFASAIRELFIDAALRNISVFVANNDWGSSYNFPNGIANQNITLSSPYAVMVGGTSITTMAAAPHDRTVEALYGLALAGNLATLWQLMEGGLMTLPSGVPASDAAEAMLLEAVWNTYAISGHKIEPGIDDVGAGDGGVDVTQATPWYQTAFGLTPTSVNPGPWGGSGRGAPDVAADAGGNMWYTTPQTNMLGLAVADGTSAATPMWTSLAAQIDTIFADQGLPNLGYMNDLLYIAAAIAPASFNDVTYGNNVTSFRLHGPIDSDGEAITLTGFGYYAGPGYDLTTGLGTPNGTLLARALSGIAHSQMHFDTSPDMLDAGGSGWQSGADQSLMFQAMSAAGAAIDIGLGTGGFDFGTAASGSYAWTNRLAQQSLQADFDANLVRLFDKQAQGWVGQSVVASGEDVSVSINATSAHAMQGTLSSPFGFADFVSDGGAVRVARAVAVAETAGGADDQIAVVRVRQNGENNLSLIFYEVDDLAGTIDGKRPGHEAYALAVEGRAYQLTSGGTSLGGPGYGNYEQAGLIGVDAGDFIAMKLTNQTTGAFYWAFAHANETVAGEQVGHLWSYGLNTWGWEDMYGGGDRDFNDLIVQLDFTSASGHGWLV